LTAEQQRKQTLMTGMMVAGGAIVLLLGAAKVVLDMASFRQAMDRPKKPWEREPGDLSA